MTIKLSKKGEDFSKWHTVAIEKEWKNENLCDITLIAKEDGTQIKAHRLVLSATNQFFKTLFFHECNSKEIEIGEISGHDLKALIQFSYSGEIEINEINVQTLLSKASRMLYTDVVELCEEFLIDQLDYANCFSLASFAESHNCKGLLNAVKSYQKEHFRNIILYNDYLNLSAEEVFKFFANRNVEDEDLERRVFDAVMKWVEYDQRQESREGFLAKLLTTVRLDLITYENLIEEVIIKVGRNAECMAFVIEAIKSKIALKENKLTIVHDREIFIYNLKDKTFETTSFPEKVHTAPDRVVLIEDNLIVISQGNDKNGVKNFNLKVRIPTDLPSTTQARWLGNVAVLNGDIYAIGSAWDGKQSVEKFHGKYKRWIKVPTNMPEEKIGHACAVLNGRIFVAGGRSESEERKNTMHCFDPKTNNWFLCASMLQGRAFFSMVAANDCLFVFGGKNGSQMETKSIEKYDLASNTWTKASELINNYESLDACLVGNKILVVGGHRIGFEGKVTLEEFDPKTNKCEVVENLPIIYNVTLPLTARLYKE